MHFSDCPPEMRDLPRSRINPYNYPFPGRSDLMNLQNITREKDLVETKVRTIRTNRTNSQNLQASDIEDAHPRVFYP